MGKSTKWLDNGILFSNMQYALCLTDKEYKRALDEMGSEPYSLFIAPGAAATTHFFDSEEQSVAIVCMDSGDWNLLQCLGILIHEATHVWQHSMELIREDTPGAEQEAYCVQIISQSLITLWLKARKKRNGKK